MSMEVLFAGVRVRQLGPAIEWYGRLFGRAPDIVPNDQEVMWRVSDGGWLYLIEEPARAGGCLVTISVTDLSSEVADLEARGVSLGPVEHIGDAGRKVRTTDPDGNAVALIQVG